MTQKRKRYPRPNATNPPYESPALNAEFNDYLASLPPGPFVADPTVKSIGVVGLLFDKDYNTLGRDLMIVTEALRLLRGAQISMDTKIKFHFYNLLAPVSSDFLMAALLDNCAPKDDAIVLCNIRGDRSGRTNFEKLRYDQQVTPFDNLDFHYMMNVDFQRGLLDRTLGTSPAQQHLQEAWGRCSDLVDAKLVFIEGTSSSASINTEDFTAGSHYQIAIDSGERLKEVSLGVAASNAFLPALQAEANPNHVLGQRILALNPVETPRAQILFPEPA